MDPLKPPLLWIGTRCYRRNPAVNAETETSNRDQDSRPQRYDDFEEPCCDDDDDSGIQSVNGGYEAQLDIPPSFFKFIIGKKGETKHRIEEETRCTIRIPRVGAVGPIVIFGQEKQNVKSARTRVELTVDSARQRLPITHFAALPVTAGKIQDRFENFKKEVLERFGQHRGIDATLFQSGPRLHLTLAVLVLEDKKEVEQAATVFENCATEVIRSVLQSEPLVTRVRGLQYMNDDPAFVDILYAKVHSASSSGRECRLQKFADSLYLKLASAGVARREREQVKLHVTLMNSKFRLEAQEAETSAGAAKKTTVAAESQPRNWERKRRDSFDATAILKEYADYDFGEIRFESIHLSIRGTTSTSGFYEPAAVVQMP